MARVEIVFLHEDTQHQSFGTAFLNQIKTMRRIEPVRKGSRALLVQDFPRQVKAVRSRGGAAALVVLIDADRDSVDKVWNILNDRLKQEGMSVISSSDLIFIASPKWRIENWIEYLRTGATNEELQGPRLEDEGSAREDAGSLYQMCVTRALPPNPPPSLKAACEQWLAFRDKLP